MNSFSQKDITVGGVRVRVLEAGEGRPLVFLHGAGATAGFDSLLPLAEKRRLIIPVHPGFGESDDDLRIDAVIDYAIHYAALFQELGLAEPIDLVGHSLGGWIASLIAAISRQPVRRLVLACPAGLRVPGITTTDLFMVPPAELLSHMVNDAETFKRLSAVPVTNEIRVARYREMTSLARIIWDKNYESKLDRWLSYVDAPTQILWGEQDRILPVELGKHWASHIPDAKLKTFPGAGHLLFAEKPEALRSTLEFLS